MAYDLIPRNKKAGDFRFGAFSWPWFLRDERAGLVIGVYPFGKLGGHIYDSKRKGSPLMNDGCKVSASEAKALAKCADTIVGAYQTDPNNKIRKDFLEKLQQFRDWALQSKGFRII